MVVVGDVNEGARSSDSRNPERTRVQCSDGGAGVAEDRGAREVVEDGGAMEARKLQKIEVREKLQKMEARGRRRSGWIHDGAGGVGSSSWSATGGDVLA